MSDIAKTLEDLVRMVRILAADKAPTMATNDVIGVASVLPPWKEGKYRAKDADHPGDIVQHIGQPWRCLQDHDSTGNPTWCPGTAPSLWGPYHATSAVRALPWQAPTGAHDCYNSGEYMVWTDGATYLCNTDSTVHGPDVLPTAWTNALIPDENVIPEWEQPDSTNTYKTGDVVTHNGKTWVSTVDNNSWEPGVYGWTEKVD